MGDYFQAKSTIEAIQANVLDEQVKAAATQKLSIIEAREAAEAEQNRRVMNSDEIQIENGGNPADQNQEGGPND
jgi:hypothetical protein